ncbi:MAG: hypothetical protein JNL82_22530 [Myxococcales bacterium]|nr:hypothetical protein [Myxococcales bacterium]
MRPRAARLPAPLPAAGAGAGALALLLACTPAHPSLGPAVRGTAAPAPSASPPTPAPSASPPANTRPSAASSAANTRALAPGLPATAPLAAAPAVSGAAPGAPAAPAPSASLAAPAPSASPVPLADPPFPELIGKPRAAVEARLGLPRAEADGWVRYADLDIKYSRGRSHRVRRVAPAGLDCADVAVWAGFDRPVGFPLRRQGGCIWPGISDRHRLEHGLAATYDAATREFEVGPRD